VRIPFRTAERSIWRDRRSGSSWLILASLLLGLTVTLVGAERFSASETYRQAYEAGYADGLQAGREDIQANRFFDVANKRQFLRADSGLKPELHDREVYGVGYRRGYEDGYEEGYGLVDDKTSLSTLAPSRRTQPAEPVVSFEASPGELVEVPAGTDIRVRLLSALSTLRNDKGDPFRAEVTEDVRQGQTVLIPRGSRLIGVVGHASRGGRISGRAEIMLRFQELHYSSGLRVPIEAAVVSLHDDGREKVEGAEGTVRAEGTVSRDAASVGTAAGIGTILGTLRGGKKGAGVGAATGGAIGLTSVLFTRGRDVELSTDTRMVIRLTRQLDLPSDAFRQRPAR
jgi:hypothetical protein